MNSNFKKIIDDFSTCMKIIDSGRPHHEPYKPGIGPHPETKTNKLVVDQMRKLDGEFYRNATTEIKYPNSRNKCDLKFELSDETIFSEVKLMRIMRDNGDLEDNAIKNILSPYPKQKSAITDGIKLLESTFEGTYSIIIIGYDNDDYPLITMIEFFELCAKKFITLSERYMSSFDDLIHPIHKKGNIFGWIVNK